MKKELVKAVAKLAQDLAAIDEEADNPKKVVKPTAKKLKDVRESPFYRITVKEDKVEIEKQAEGVPYISWQEVDFSFFHHIGTLHKKEKWEITLGFVLAHLFFYSHCARVAKDVYINEEKKLPETFKIELDNFVVDVAYWLTKNELEDGKTYGIILATGLNEEDEWVFSAKDSTFRVEEEEKE